MEDPSLHGSIDDLVMVWFFGRRPFDFLSGLSACVPFRGMNCRCGAEPAKINSHVATFCTNCSPVAHRFSANGSATAGLGAAGPGHFTAGTRRITARTRHASAEGEQDAWVARCLPVAGVNPAIPL